MSEALARLARFRDHLPEFASACLKIRDKSGAIVPLVMNPTQQLIHDRLEAQKAETGWVRAIVLKARQPGVSTYVAARFYHRAALRKGVNTYILSHEIASTDNLFNIVDRFQRNSAIAPHVGTANAKELVFDRLESSYVVATAGQKAGGRGRATTLFHGSEVAFWASAADHFSSSVQGVPLMAGTEVILESTANGPSGEFYQRVQDSIAGRGDYILVFIPWFLTAEYAREPEPGFELSTEKEDDQPSEVEITELFGLSMAQMCWRRNKILELRSEDTFRQEYPSTPQEAFVSAGHSPFISPLAVLRAQKRKTEGYGPLVFGVDPASMGGDRFSVCARRGMRVEWVKYRNKIDVVEGKAWVQSLIDEHDPARVNIDAGNIGAALITLLKAAGPKYVEKVRAINFGGTSQAKLARPKTPGPANRRAEMWGRTKEWLADESGASLPDGFMENANIGEMLRSDLSAPRQKQKLNNDWLLESKVEMKTRGVRSPDLGDSLALTFAQSETLTKYSEPKKVQAFGDIDRPRESYMNYDREAGSGGWMA